MTMRVINLWAGPGAGKSTTASDLFARMKHDGLKVELVTEYAKELTYEGAFDRLNHQLIVLGEQDYRQRRLIGKVDWVITDSPLPLSLVYARDVFNAPWFQQAALALFGRYDNINVRVLRVKPYRRYGRTQSEQEARRVDGQIDALADLIKFDVRVPGDETAAPLILAHVRALASMQEAA